MTCGLCAIHLVLISIFALRPAYADGLSADERIGMAFSASGCAVPVHVQAPLRTRSPVLADGSAASRRLPRPRPSPNCGNDPAQAPVYGDSGKAFDEGIHPDALLIMSRGQFGSANPGPDVVNPEIKTDPYQDWIAAGDIIWAAEDGPAKPTPAGNGK
jgi:hypothetical protein